MILNRANLRPDTWQNPPEKIKSAAEIHVTFCHGYVRKIHSVNIPLGCTYSVKNASKSAPSVRILAADCINVAMDFAAFLKAD